METMTNSILIDITQEMNEFKAENTCSICENLYEDPVVLKSCEHVFCKKCLSIKVSNCPACNIPFAAKDVEDDNFTLNIVSCISNILKIEETIKDTMQPDGKDAPELQTKEISSFLKNLSNPLILSKDMKRNSKGETPLHIACRKGQLDKVKELIGENVDLNVKDYAGWTPLHEAVQGNHIECVEELLKNGALIDVPGEYYSTPLHKAAALGHYKIVHLMIQLGANIGCCDYEGNMPILVSSSEEIRNLFLILHSEQHIVPKYFIKPSAIVHYSRISQANKIKTDANIKIVSTNDFLNKDNATHLVVGMNESLSMKVLVAILKGLFVVEKDWVLEYTKSHDNLSALNYLPQMFRTTFEASILNQLQQLPRLFDGINFHIIDHNKPYEILGVKFLKQDLIKLIEIGGGKYLHRAPALRTVGSSCFYPYHANRTEACNCANYIIYMESQKPELIYNMKELQHKTSKWLIDCILHFSILTSY